MGVIDWILIVLYFVFIAVIGYQTTKKVKTVKDYNVAGEKISWTILFASLAASILGGGASTGMAGNVYKEGYVFMFAFFAYGIASILIGIFIAPKLKKYKNAQTVGDIMQVHYGNKAKLITGILSVGLCTGILGGQALAIGTMLNVILEIPPLVGILIGMGSVILYTSFGGVMAVIQTDVLQFVLLGVILPLTLIIGINAVGGAEVLIANVPDLHFTFLGEWGIATFIGLFITFLLGEALIPPYTQRVFTSKDPESASKGYIISGFFSFGFYFVTATLGLIAFVLYPDIRTDTALPAIVKQLLPVGITGLAVAALLAVIMSTASSFLNSTTVSFMRDVFPFINKKTITDKQELFIGRVLTAVIGVIAVIFALNVPSIISALEYSYYLWAPTIVFPLVIGILLKIKNPTAGIVSIIVGAITTIIWTFVLNEPFSMSGVAPGFVANIIAFCITHNITKQSGLEKVNYSDHEELVKNDVI
ncbi:sodium:solute symporter [Lysinibacillus sp. 2017]|uniref:sodium:solute symporter family protein n=1 Tax=unclassified Lysinibacillus TaxID=2636778 RepID=UPI000D5297F1|nr:MULTISPECIES: sodium:solute symporter family protein [unclassified Lysinibacillus]AWE06130.1 sodium:solute symporter [Lysinibacillus sp. 2017]TGN35215.1 sodium:solute symporter family protein [Lysinibacillus sp. S2017]